MLTDDRITEMQNAIIQRCMIGGAVLGDTNKTVTAVAADVEFPAMIIEISNQLYPNNVFTTVGVASYSFNAASATPHQFVIPIGDYRNEA